jgi:hypothetical protein
LKILIFLALVISGPASAAWTCSGAGVVSDGTNTYVYQPGILGTNQLNEPVFFRFAYGESGIGTSFGGALCNACGWGASSTNFTEERPTSTAAQVVALDENAAFLGFKISAASDYNVQYLTCAP